jgi:hypothetical protein
MDSIQFLSWVIPSAFFTRERIPCTSWAQCTYAHLRSWPSIPNPRAVSAFSFNPPVAPSFGGKCFCENPPLTFPPKTNGRSQSRLSRGGSLETAASLTDGDLAGRRHCDRPRRPPSPPSPAAATVQAGLGFPGHNPGAPITVQTGTPPPSRR